MIGKKIRLGRISSQGKYILVPMDHGLTDGPIPGIENLENTIQNVAQGGATAIVLHKGPIMQMTQAPPLPVIMHVSASTSLGSPNRKVLIGTPEEALRLGADAFSIHINLGAESEPEMIEEAGLISEACALVGLPLLAMVYPRGPKIKNPYDPDLVKHAARLGYELGADIVKTVYTGDPKSFKEVVQGCKVPVIIAGGPKISDTSSLLQMVADAINSGAQGVAFGRNLFQATDQRKMVNAVKDIVLGLKSQETVLEDLK